MENRNRPSKRITFVIPSIAYGGAETQLINQINGLQGLGFYVSLIVFSNIEILGSINLPKKQILVLRRSISFLGIQELFAAREILLPILEFIRDNKTEIVVANLPIAHFVMRVVKLLGKAKGIKFKLFHYHHSMQYEESPLDNFLKRSFNSLNSLFARLADSGNIFISQSVYKSIQGKIHIENPVIVPNAIPFKNIDETLAEQFFVEISLPSSAYLITVPGRINEAKGQLFFIRALKKFITLQELKTGQLYVIFAGGGNLQRETEDLIQALDLGEFCFISGNIDNGLLLSLLRKSDLVVIPSIFEGFGNVAIEAMMAKSVILASDAGGLKEIIRDSDNGFVFEALNESSLLNKLEFLYQNRFSPIIDKESVFEEFKQKYEFNIHLNRLLNLFN